MTDAMDSVAEEGRAKRSRVKSQRALESEQTDRLLARARAQQRANESSIGESSNSSTLGVAPPPAKKGRVKAQKKKDEPELYCICKTDGNDGRPMIECGVCNDWFHFYCIHLSEEGAESIHKYVCNGCEIRTGEKTTHIFDIGVFPSPSPPPGFEIEYATKPVTKPAKAKSVKKRSTTRASASASSSSGDSASDAENVSASSSDDSGSEAGGKPATKKPRLSRAKDSSRSKISSSVDRKPNAPIRKPSAVLPAGALPPARAHVLTRLTGVIRTLFAGKLNEAEVNDYVSELEAALWSNFKEYVGGKDVVGTRYKGQFNLLSSSLSRPLRDELRESILNRSLTPTQVANLTSADLASAERAKEIEAAKQAVLQQTVKSREDGPAAIRLGRDGLERAEDFREKEMKALQASEIAAREKEQRRNSVISETAGEEAVEVSKSKDHGRGSDSSGQQTGLSKMQHRRSESTDIVAPRPASSTPSATPLAGGSTSQISTQSPVPTPTRQFSLSSAWGAKGKDEPSSSVDANDVELAFGVDQNQVDLSDIVVGDDQEEIELSVNTPAEPSAESRFIDRPVAWKGGVINPAFPIPRPVRTLVRHVATKALQPSWKVLMPQDPISMVGRVPNKDSLKHLSDARFNPKMELVVVAFTCDPEADADEQGWWNGMIQDHINRDRHGIYHPYGDFKRNTVPPGGARELYFIPLRPEDKIPEFTELIDGFELPPTRSSSMYLGVFVIHRDDSPAQKLTPSIPPVAPPPAFIVPPAGPSATPPVPNPDIQALLAKLDTSALQSLSAGIPMGPPGGHSPLPPVPVTPHQGGYTPPQGYYPPASYGAAGGYDAYAQQHHHHHPQPQQGYHDPHYGPPGSHGSGYGYDQGYGQEYGRQSGGRGGHGPGQGGGPRDVRGRGRGGGFEGRGRDNGWGSRRN